MSLWATIGWAAAAVVGTAGSALCAGAEMGIYSLSRVRLNLLASGILRGGFGPAVRRVRHIPRRPRDDAAQRRAIVLREEIEDAARLLAALLVGYNIFSALGSLGVTGLLTTLGYSEGWIIAINAIVIGPILFVAVDSLPKELFRAEADRLTYTLTPFLRAGRLLLTWTLVLPAVQWAVRTVSALVPAGDEPAFQSSRQRIAQLLKEGARHGVISESQVTLLDRALSLREARVGDEMVRWSRCKVIETTWDRPRTLAFILANPFSRFPVTDRRGNVVGIVSHADITLNAAQTPAQMAIPTIALEPAMTVRDALPRMQSAGARMGVVIDRGRPVGIVTVKDLVEPLIGELAAW